MDGAESAQDCMMEETESGVDANYIKSISPCELGVSENIGNEVIVKEDLNAKYVVQDITDVSADGQSGNKKCGENIPTLPDEVKAEAAKKVKGIAVSQKDREKITGMLMSLSKYKECEEEDIDNFFTVVSPKKTSKKTQKSPKKVNNESNLHEFLAAEIPAIKAMSAESHAAKDEEKPDSDVASGGFLEFNPLVSGPGQNSSKKKKNKQKNIQDNFEEMVLQDFEAYSISEEQNKMQLPKKSKKKGKQIAAVFPEDSFSEGFKAMNLESTDTRQECGGGKLGSYTQLLQTMGNGRLNQMSPKQHKMEKKGQQKSPKSKSSGSDVDSNASSEPQLLITVDNTCNVSPGRKAKQKQVIEKDQSAERPESGGRKKKDQKGGKKQAEQERKGGKKNQEMEKKGGHKQASYAKEPPPVVSVGNPVTEMTVRIPKCDHKFVLGPGGSHLQEIFSVTGVCIGVPAANKDSEEVILRGEQLQLGPAVAIMFSKVQQAKTDELLSKGARPKEAFQPAQGQGQCHNRNKAQQGQQHQKNKGQSKVKQNTVPADDDDGEWQSLGQNLNQNANRGQGQYVYSNQIWKSGASQVAGGQGQMRGNHYGNMENFQQNQYKGQKQQGNSRGNPPQFGTRGQGPKQRQSESQRSWQGQENRSSTPECSQATTPKSQGKRQRKKKNVFNDYISDEELSHGLKNGTLIQGPVRINPKNFEEAYVPHPDGCSDVMLVTFKARNRALNGDIVAVKLCEKGEWKLNTEQLQDLEDSFQMKKQTDSDQKSDAGNSDEEVVIESEEIVEIISRPDASQKESSTGEVNSPSVPGKSSPMKSKNKGDDSLKKRFTSLSEVMSGGSPKVKKMLGEGGSVEAEKLIQRTGQVVAIVERKHSRATTGHIKLLADRNPDRALFCPNDHRVPRVLIPMKDCPKDFIERPEDYGSTLYVCRITDWRKDSQYADGVLAKSLGEAGEIEPETEGMLIENGVDFEDFPEEALDCLPKQLPWVIPAAELDSRRDFRSACVFTIDPSTARDLDDALSCEELGNGRYKVGVHIADVSYFVTEGTKLDAVASIRSTSVYLVHKVIPMLPRLLCEQLCSLNPDEDRLTFSVEWTITEEGEIEDEWFGRSVIRSCTKLSYDHAQGFIEQPDREWTQEELPPISEGFSVNDIQTRVLNLHKVACSLRKGRFDSGALRLDQVKLQYSLDKESGMPNGYWVYQQRDSNRLVEEFMLLANMAVAHRINSYFPDKALLRRHPPPQEKAIEGLRDLCSSLGLHIDIKSAGSLQRSLASYYGYDEYSMARMQILTTLCSKPMQNAKYFCTGCLDDESAYRHYALNVPLYTHFTSPIRRYPDVIVHRLLAASLDYCEVVSDSPKMIQQLSEHCNDKKLAAKRVGELSSELFFSVFVKTAGPLEEKAMVMNVLDKAFDIFVLKLGVSKRVYCDKLPIKEKVFRKERKVPSLTLVWETEDGEPAITQEVTIFTVVDSVLQQGDQPLQWTAIIKRPQPVQAVVMLEETV